MGLRFTNLPAYLMWGFIHVQYLVGWGNRLGTMYTWARALYLSKNRGHRIISFQTAGYEVGGQRILVRSVQPRTTPDPAEPAPVPAPAVEQPGPPTIIA
jgi:NADH dehydrogenase